MATPTARKFTHELRVALTVAATFKDLWVVAFHMAYAWHRHIEGAPMNMHYYFLYATESSEVQLISNWHTFATNPNCWLLTRLSVLFCFNFWNFKFPPLANRVENLFWVKNIPYSCIPNEMSFCLVLGPFRNCYWCGNMCD